MLTSSGTVAGVVTLLSAGMSLKPPLREKWRRKVDQWRPSVSFLRDYCTLPRKHRLAWLDNLALAQALRGIREEFRPGRLILCTGAAAIVPTLVTLRDRGLADRVVYHVWGPDAEEHVFAQQSGSRQPPDPSGIEAIRTQQRQAIGLVDANISISRAMTDWLISSMHADPDTIFELPWLADARVFEDVRQHRNEVRQQLGLSDSLVLGYSGSMLSWQLEPLALKKIVSAFKRTFGEVAFLGLTMHEASMRRALQESGLSDTEVRVLSVPFSQVPRYLSAMDVGILGRNLFREPDTVNRLSSPVKFGEYLLSGVPVILSAALEDFAQLSRSNDIGVVVDQNASERDIGEALKALMSDDRAKHSALADRCIETGRRHLTYQGRWDAYTAALGLMAECSVQQMPASSDAGATVRSRISGGT
jgi:hypothetical protein